MLTIILAAGYGTRLYPLTLNKPKALLEVAGRTILDRLVDEIELVKECRKIIIVTNDKFHLSFEMWAGSRKTRPEIEVIDDLTTSDETRLGAIGDINLVLEKESPDEDLLIAGSDNLFKLNFRDFVEFGKKKRPFPSIALFDVKDKNLATQYGICSLNRDARVIDFEEKPAAPESTLAATALYFVPREKISGIFNYMKTGLSKDAPGNLMKWFAKNDKLFGFVLDKGWYDIGDTESLREADEDFRRKEKKGS